MLNKNQINYAHLPIVLAMRQHPENAKRKIFDIGRMDLKEMQQSQEHLLSPCRAFVFYKGQRIVKDAKDVNDLLEIFAISSCLIS